MRQIDIKGNRYGKWTVIEALPREKGKSGSTRWICRCDCGTEVHKDSYHLRKTWNSPDCGCARSLVGKKFNHLLVIERLLKNGIHEGNYVCRCVCGREKIYRGTQIISESVKTCGCGRKNGINENGRTLVWLSYRTHAKKRNLVFELTKERFVSLIESSCFYCGKLETNRMQAYKRVCPDEVYLHNGVDRLDNQKGYTVENSVPCCKYCNHMKWNLSHKEWMEHMTAVLNYQQPQAAQAV